MFGKEKMKMSREEAEKLINSSEVVATTVRQKQQEIQVHFKLSNSQTCIVTYNRSTHKKSYRLGK